MYDKSDYVVYDYACMFILVLLLYTLSEMTK